MTISSDYVVLGGNKSSVDESKQTLSNSHRYQAFPVVGAHAVHVLTKLVRQIDQVLVKFKQAEYFTVICCYFLCQLVSHCSPMLFISFSGANISYKACS